MTRNRPLTQQELTDVISLQAGRIISTLATQRLGNLDSRSSRHMSNALNALLSEMHGLASLPPDAPIPTHIQTDEYYLSYAPPEPFIMLADIVRQHIRRNR